MGKGLLRRIGSYLLNSLDNIEYAFVPNELTKFIIDRGQKFYTIPALSAQGRILLLTKRYGIGSELEFQKIFSYTISRGDIVVDVGAHFGFYTLIAAERVGNSGVVLAFEPSSLNYKILTMNVHNNGYNNVKLLNFALGDANTTAKLALPKSGKSGENTMVTIEEAKMTEIIEVRRFETLFYEDNILTRAPDVVKIDVEGAEVLVLRGFGDLLSDVGYIFCEIHPKQMKFLNTDIRELFDILYSKNFSIYVITMQNNNYKLVKLTDPSKIKDRCHIIAINSRFFDEKIEYKKISNILQKQYTLGAKKIELHSTKRILSNLAKLIYYTKAGIISAYHQLFQKDDQ